MKLYLISAFLLLLASCDSKPAKAVDPEPHEVEAVLATGRIHCVQFHGQESPEFCAGFGVPFLKTVRVSSLEDARIRIDDDLIRQTHVPTLVTLFCLDEVLTKRPMVVAYRHTN